MRAALYLRTSTLDQTTDNQERELRAVAERLGHEVVEIYADNGISGAKGRDKRPAFDRLCRDATGRRRLDPRIRAGIRAAYAAGEVGMRAVAKKFGVAVETVRRCLSEPG